MRALSQAGLPGKCPLGPTRKGRAGAAGRGCSAGVGFSGAMTEKIGTRVPPWKVFQEFTFVTLMSSNRVVQEGGQLMVFNIQRGAALGCMLLAALSVPETSAADPGLTHGGSS